MIIIRLFNLLQKETENWLPATILCTLKEVIRFIKKQFTIDMFQFSWINILYTTKKILYTSVIYFWFFGGTHSRRIHCSGTGICIYISENKCKKDHIEFPVWNKLKLMRVYLEFKFWICWDSWINLALQTITSLLNIFQPNILYANWTVFVSECVNIHSSNMTCVF